MKVILVIIFLFLISSCTGDKKLQTASQDFIYQLDLRHQADDLFHVEMAVSGLKKENNIFNFAATAPGTYQTMNMGRFVRSFTAYDQEGNLLQVDSISVNQRMIHQIEKLAKIKYSIAETFDTKVSDNYIYEMCGSSFEDDHAYVNGQTVFGYFKGLQSKSFKLSLLLPENWKVGSALNFDGKYYYAESYDHIVDSPIMAGRLTQSETWIQNTKIVMYVYSKTDLIIADSLLSSMQAMLQSANKFLKELPVKHYSFLFFFENKTVGAWEHSYSSSYVYSERPWSKKLASELTSTAAHEFFHIVTPLNLHSEIIQEFNFENPTPSRHLWLYEGVTEWASHAMQLRSGLINTEKFLGEMTNKINYNEYLQNALPHSLLDLSLTCYTPQGQQVYVNIYMLGAITATMMDIQLLELSNGQRGLREVILELTKKYGKHKAFTDSTFINEFVAMTYPEMSHFFNNYILDKHQIDLQSYFAKVGIEYHAQKETDEEVKSLGLAMKPNENGTLNILKIEDQSKIYGFSLGDELLEFNGIILSQEKFYEVMSAIDKLGINEPYVVKIKRGDQVHTIQAKTYAKKKTIKHYLAVNPKADERAVKLRNAWLQNL